VFCNLFFCLPLLFHSSSVGSLFCALFSIISLFFFLSFLCFSCALMTGIELRTHYPYLSLRNWLIDTTVVVVNDDVVAVVGITLEILLARDFLEFPIRFVSCRCDKFLS